MRKATQRSGKYRAKIQGKVLPGQARRFTGAAGGQVAAEHYVKVLGVPAGFQNYYMIFAKELLKVRRIHSGEIAQREACLLYDKWSSRGLDASVLDSMVVHYNFQSCPVPPPPVCDWSYKRKLTFSGNVSATNLDDFTVLVHLTAANFDFNKAQNLGEDIRFMDTDACPGAGTPLKHEIEKWDKAGNEAWVWVKVPRIDGGSVNDFIYMFYGNAAAPDGQDVPGTWDSNYVLVMHVHGTAPSVVATDSTAYGNNGAVTGAAWNAGGQINGCLSFNGVNNHVECPDSDSLDVGPGSNKITMELWARRDNITAAVSLFDKIGDLGGGNWRGYLLNTYPNDRLLVSIDSGAAQLIIDDFFVAGDVGNWVHVVATGDGSVIRAYKNGAVNALTGNYSTITATNFNLRVGRRRDGSQPFAGRIDEARISKINRSGDWVMASYRAQAGLLITYGPEESE